MRQAIFHFIYFTFSTLKSETTEENVEYQSDGKQTISDYTAIDQCEIDHGKLKIMLDRMLDKVSRRF